MATNLLLQYKIFLVMAPVIIVCLILIFGMIYRVRLTAPTATPLLWLCLLLLGFIVCNSLEQILTTPEGTVLFAKTAYLFFTAIPVAWIVFALRYTGRDDWFKRRYLIFLMILPVIADGLAFTNELHGLIWRKVAYVPVGDLLTMRVEHGFGFYVVVAYIYLFLFAGALLIFREFLRSPQIYKRQASWVVAGVVIPVAFNTIYIFRLVPGLVKDYTCLGLFFSIVCFYIGIFRYRLLELLPIARAMIIEQMKDGVIILRSDMTILDLNLQAKTVIGATGDLVGKPFDLLDSVCPVLVRACRERIAGQKSKKIGVAASPYLIESAPGREQQYLDIECVNILKNEKSIGHLITLHDVTERIKLIKRVEELARTDELTGLFNRRHFMEIYARELDRCNRYQKPLSLAILDIDYFKSINDAYGHPSGDRVLAALGQGLPTLLRSADTVARLGGEEFGVLMPETDEEEAWAVCRRLQEAVAKLQIVIGRPSSPDGEAHLFVTVSIGVAGAKPDADREGVLFEQADKALYRAKNAGRNQVVLWGNPESGLTLESRR